MISYKTLLILTVLFDILIHCNGSVEECNDTLVKIGFESVDKFAMNLTNTGFYNLNFILQFKDYEEFLQHVITRIDIKSHGEVILTEKYSYLDTFYKSIYSARSEDLERILKTPQKFCILKVIEDEVKPLEGSALKNVQEFKEFEEFKKKLITKCTTSILNFEHENGNKIFMYDEHNQYKCLLATYDMAVLNNPDKDRAELFGEILDKYKSVKPEGHVHHYYLYNIKIFEVLYNTYYWFTPSKLCEQYFSNQNEGSENLAKDVTLAE